MRKRFGRGGRRGRRGGPPEARPAAIDVGAALERIVEAGVAEARSLEPLEDPEIPATLAAVGIGEGESGSLLVGFSPHNGGDAALAAVAAALRLVEEGTFDGEVVAVAPQWTIAGRRRLALIGAPPLRFRAVAATPLAADGARVAPEPEAIPMRVSLAQAAAALEAPADRELFVRAAASLEGLAAKHGGCVRGTREGAEFVLLAQRTALLRAAPGVSLETLRPEPSTESLTLEGLANAMDRLEGLLRRLLNDKRIRSSEEGLRAQLVDALAAEAGVRAGAAWPLPGADPEILDLVGVQADGVPALGAVRKELGLASLGAILDAVARLGPSLPGLVSAAGAPLRLGSLRLLVAARDFDAAVLRVLPTLALEVVGYDVALRRGRQPALARRTLDRSAAAPAAVSAAASEPAPTPTPEAHAPPRRRPEPERAAPARPRFEEVSFFDLDEDSGGGRDEPERSSTRRRRRGRRRRTGRRPGGSEAEEGSGGAEAEAEPAVRPRRDGRQRRPSSPNEEPSSPNEEDALDDLDLTETLAPLAEDVPDLDVAAEPVYDEEDEAEGSGDDRDTDVEDALAEREARLQAGLAKASAEAEAEAEAQPEAPPAPRRRAAIVAHADRDSVIAALLLARDLRLVEGFWVYPQSELMTFFRSVATDLREETPVCVIGFTASPARDTIQAASLYAGRLDWFDHHEWPPEDLEALREAIGRDRVVVHPGAGSAVPGVLSVRSRRSRFSDKLVELATGSFTHHDYDRWGRVWWQRLAEVAGRSGERRSDLEPLLVGRPSDLAREAASAPAPPLPPEAAYVSERDFRLVHFGAYTLVVVPVPDALDLYLAGRIARERYGAPLSLSHRADSELIVLGGDEGRGRRGTDLGRMVEHLAAKHAWIEALPAADHVARLRVRDFASRPERLDEVIREIAMGRSILEG